MKVKISGFRNEHTAATSCGKLVKIAVNATTRPVPGAEIEVKQCADGMLRPVDQPKK